MLIQASLGEIVPVLGTDPEEDEDGDGMKSCGRAQMLFCRLRSPQAKEFWTKAARQAKCANWMGNVSSTVGSRHSIPEKQRAAWQDSLPELQAQDAELKNGKSGQRTGS